MTTRHCAVCEQPLRPGARADARYCSTRCRVTAHRNPNLIRTDEPKPAPASHIRIETYGWFCTGIIPTNLRAQVEEIYQRVGDEFGRVDLGPGETIQFSNPRSLAVHIELLAPIGGGLEAAEAFAGAVTALIE